MARSITTLPRRNSSSSFLSAVKLARWQMRQTWRLLLITGTGILIAVVLLCAVPLYAQIVISAGVRGAMQATPEGTFITVHSISEQISRASTDSVANMLNQEFHDKLGAYTSTPQFSLQANGLKILRLAQNPGAGPVATGALLNVIGSSIQLDTSHIKLIQGRLPLPQSKDIEIAIIPETASALHLAVGSLLPVQVFAGNVPAAQANQRNLMLHVVGMFALASDNDPYWHQETFVFDPEDNGVPPTFKALASNGTLFDVLGQIHTTAAMGGNLTYLVPPDLFWYYGLDVSHIDANKLDDLINGVNSVLTDVSDNPVANPYVTETRSVGPINALQAYHNYISVVRIPATSLTLLLMALVLYFVSVMTDLLVDRKSESIAILRSRGASRRQIFSLFVAQSIGLGLVALLLGPLLAVVAARFFAQYTLAGADLGALNILTLDVGQVALGLLTSALLAVLVAIIAMIISIYRATRADILSARRESARATRRSLWQRMYLDVVAAIIALTGYVFSIYVTNPGVLSTRVRVLVLSPMTLVGATFLLLGATLLFLRAFPLLLHLSAWLAQRSRSAAPMLALAQMARAPRASVRTIMLLALATAFTIFALVFSASQAQRIQDVAAYQVGADFSGKISGSATIARSATYSHLPGILAATVGYTSSERAAQNGGDISVELRAVDANTYAQTAAWSEQDSSQSLSSLMTQLVAQRSSVLAKRAVPAIVDASAWNTLRMSVGSHFTMSDLNGPIDCVVVAEVQHIPTVNDTTEANDTGDYIPSGGVLVDYQSYATLFLKANNTLIPTTDVWLRSASDPATLARVRNELVNGAYYLNNLNDRRAIIASLNSDPLYIALLGMLTIGAITALLLALVGNLIASWQNAHSRLRNFAVLRALGSNQKQIASVLLWEQAIVYATAILLGMLFGVLLSALALPALVFTSVGGNTQINNGEFYVMQSVPAIQVVIPLSLWITLPVLIVVCIIALGMMVRIVSRPSIGQMLRLNED
ncbi:MAG: FtsX-like permease family protein [Ktedonobacteraceae bacterium]